MRGWSDEDLIKISRGNILRVMKSVEEFAKKSKDSGEKPREEWIPNSDVAGVNCRTEETYFLSDIDIDHKMRN